MLKIKILICIVMFIVILFSCGTLNKSQSTDNSSHKPHACDSIPEELRTVLCQ